jgi:hypothetical protein
LFQKMRAQYLLARGAVALLMSGVSCLNLNVTAIGAQDGRSTIECWQMNTPFNISTQPGTAGTAIVTLSDVANVTYTVLPSNFDGGVHNAPVNQWVAFTTGLAYITLPEDPDTTAYVTGGEFGFIFASDVAGVSEVGHRTQYPGITETIALQIPTRDGEVPAHSVLHIGPCTADEISGIRSLAVASVES